MLVPQKVIFKALLKKKLQKYYNYFQVIAFKQLLVYRVKKKYAAKTAYKRIMKRSNF